MSKPTKKKGSGAYKSGKVDRPTYEPLDPLWFTEFVHQDLSAVAGDEISQFGQAFADLMDHAYERGVFSEDQEAMSACDALFRVFWELFVNGNTRGVVAAAGALVEKDPDTDRPNYSRFRGSVGRGGWLIALRVLVPPIRERAETLEKMDAARALVSWLSVYDDRAGERELPDWLSVGLGEAPEAARWLSPSIVVRAVEEMLPPNAAMDSTALIAIAARLSTQCGAFGDTNERKARNAFRSYK